jgi:hypothetical protein
VLLIAASCVKCWMSLTPKSCSWNNFLLVEIDSAVKTLRRAENEKTPHL